MNKSCLLFVIYSLTFILMLAISQASASACSRLKGPFSFNELFVADVIVRATAVKYVVAPDPYTGTTGVPESTIEFKVEEVLKGENVPETIVLNGYLSDRDDYNDVEVPYKFVRPGGRAGSCFANTYKEGAQFLLFLKKNEESYTPNISPLGPTNEQLRGSDDEWLQWVKEYLKTHERKESKVGFLEHIAKSMTAWSLVYLIVAS